MVRQHLQSDHGLRRVRNLPSPWEILPKLDAAIREHAPSWKDGTARDLFKSMVETAYRAIERPGPGRKNAITTTNLWHFRHQFAAAVKERRAREQAAIVWKWEEERRRTDALIKWQANGGGQGISESSSLPVATA